MLSALGMKYSFRVSYEGGEGWLQGMFAVKLSMGEGAVSLMVPRALMQTATATSTVGLGRGSLVGP